MWTMRNVLISFTLVIYQEFDCDLIAQLRELAASLDHFDKKSFSL